MGIFRLVQCVSVSQGTYLCIICGVEIFLPVGHEQRTDSPSFYIYASATDHQLRAEMAQKLTDRRVIERPTGNVLGGNA